MGTPGFALPSLRMLAAEHDVIQVYTQPDRPCGRGRVPKPPPVKAAALDLGLEVRQPQTLRDPQEHGFLESLGPDVICVAAYGLILPPEVLEIPRYGCVNVHASLLPHYRGAAPVHRSILAGDRETGVSIMLMEEGLDTGPYAHRVAVPVGERSVDELTEVLAEVGAEALSEVLREIEDGTVVWTPQDDSKASYAAKITRDDVALEPSLTVAEAHRRIRASSASAPSRACVSGRLLTVVRGSIVRPGPEQGSVHTTRDSLVLGFADGGISLDEIRPEGKGCMDGACFARGARLDDRATWGTAT